MTSELQHGHMTSLRVIDMLTELFGTVQTNSEGFLFDPTKSCYILRGLLISSFEIVCVSRWLSPCRSRVADGDVNTMIL